jgi:hypothetical protein
MSNTTDNATIAAILRILAGWMQEKAEHLYEAAASAIEAGATDLSPELRSMFKAVGVMPPRVHNVKAVVTELRRAVYNASSYKDLTENQAWIDEQLTELGVDPKIAG